MALWKYFAEFFGSYYTCFIVLTVNLSSVLNGMLLAWTSPVLVKLNKEEDNPLGRQITKQQSEIIGYLLFISAAIGPLLSVKSSESLGRKKTLILCLIPALLGYIILVFAKTIELYYAARILSGITIGAVVGLAQSYLSEIILSAKTRGPYLAICSPAIQLGLFLSYLIGPYVSIVVFNGIIFLINFLIIVLICIGCPESPYSIYESKGKNASLYILKSLDSKKAETELLQIGEDRKKETRTSLLALFESQENIKPFIMATTLLLLQQFSGITILMSYSQLIFEKSREILPSEQCSIIVGFIQVLSATAITFTSRKFSRKSLLIVSLFGSGVFDLILGIYFFYAGSLSGLIWIPLLSLVLFAIFYNSGLDAIPWVYVGEIFPQHLKTVGITASIFVYELTCAISSFTFSEIDVCYLFLAHSVCCFFGVFYVKVKLTETKDKKLSDIQKELEELR